MFLKQLRISAVVLILMTLLAGVLYPLAITGLAQLLFPRKANGSIIIKNGKVIGSELIGQQFSSQKYFWSRISNTSPYPYNAGASSGSNFSTLNPALRDIVKKRIQDLKSIDSLNIEPVPIDLATSSSSGLDPHISIASAQYQATRIARVRGISVKQVQSVITQNTEKRTFGIFGEPRVNVLKLNLTLDEIQ